MSVETPAPEAYPADGSREGQKRSRDTAVSEMKNLGEAYTLFSALTNMPYVECEEENYNDQVRLYQEKEEAEAEAEALGGKGIRVTVRGLRTVEVALPVKPGQQTKEKKKGYLSQVRQYLGTLPYIGVNAVCFKAKGKKAQSIELTEILPEDFEKKMGNQNLSQPNLQLTGLYLMQEARRKKEYVDMKQIQALDEEFCSNLVRSRLFLAVLPPEGQEWQEKTDLKQCRLPYLKHQNGERFFPVFTDIWEFRKYAAGKKDLRPIQVPFGELSKFWVKDAKAYMVNPMGFSLPLAREMIPRIQERFKVSETPS